MIADPPFDAGGVNATDTCPLLAVAVPTVGAPGALASVTEFEAADPIPVPAALVAVTEKV